MILKAPDSFAESFDYLHEVSSKICGLHDFGTDDYSIGLRVLLHAMDVDPHFTPKGREMAWNALTATLVSRLYAEENFKKYPEWKSFKLKAPIMICGLPRSGTTVLHKLLSADPQFQGVQNWLTRAPQPRPPRDQWDRHPAFQRAVKALVDQHAESPDLMLAHRVVADEVDENIELQRGTFASHIFGAIWYCAGYDAWWATRIEGPDVHREFNLLRLIGCHEPEKPYLLKNPATIGQLDYWFEEVPDVRIIQTHRDPVKAMASVASTLNYYRASFEGEAIKRTRKISGPREVEKWATMIDRGMVSRRRLEENGHPNQFFDVYHHDFHARPMETVGRIYDHFGLQMSAKAEEAIVARIKDNPDGHGQHKYDLETFGLTRQMVNDRYKHYIETYHPAGGDL